MVGLYDEKCKTVNNATALMTKLTSRTLTKQSPNYLIQISRLITRQHTEVIIV